MTRSAHPSEIHQPTLLSQGNMKQGQCQLCHVHVREFINVNIDIFKLINEICQARVMVMVHGPGQKRTRADAIIQMHPPTTHPTTFQYLYKSQKTRKRTRRDVMLYSSQQPTRIPPWPLPNFTGLSE